ncbi:hypothetical protein C8Q75DRAFT_733250 [Abortiporus biennis]|nr:hypothetical protein C8Q75DRAFT_733250 [Abortiporus biennis]
MFGGQLNGEFLNDLWEFDLNSLRSKAMWELVEPAEGSCKPSHSTGHMCYLRGETFLLVVLIANITIMTLGFSTRTLVYGLSLTALALSEGHAAALVDDVIYVFGGRGVDGEVLGDLRAFRLSSVKHNLCYSL